MSRVFIHGVGAVSPAGWGVSPLSAALRAGKPLPVETVPRPGGRTPLPLRPIPAPAVRPEFLAHPRLRRAGAMAQFVTAAAIEALGGDVTAARAGAPRLGVIVCTLAGSVTYSRRFYGEVLHDPPTASPLIFPETVFNAAASHLGAYLGSTTVNYCLVGDSGTFLQALGLAAELLEDDQIDGCIVAGAEEADWIVANAIRLFQRSTIYAGGAGALYLRRDIETGVELMAVTDAMSFVAGHCRREAARRVRAQLPPGGPEELLCDTRERANAWQNWPGQTMSLGCVLGEAFNALAAWQCVAACDALKSGEFTAANVSVVGTNQQAIGARFTRTKQT